MNAYALCEAGIGCVMTAEAQDIIATAQLTPRYRWAYDHPLLALFHSSLHCPHYRECDVYFLYRVRGFRAMKPARGSG